MDESKASTDDVCGKGNRSHASAGDTTTDKITVYRSEEDALRNALRAVARSEGLSENDMPSTTMLLAHGRGDVVNAIARSGGVACVASRFGLLPTPRARTRVQNRLNRLLNSKAPSKQELFLHLSQPRIANDRLCNSTYGSSPGYTTLNSNNVRVPQVHTVSASLVEEDEQKRKKRPRGTWLSWKHFEAELRAFANEKCNGVMPSQSQFRSFKRCDLLNAVRHHGGVHSIARRAGLPVASTRRPRGHWIDRTVLHGELLAHTAVNGHPGLMPRYEELMEAGRSDLCYAIRKFGGYSTVAAELHLTWFGPSSYWRSFRNLRKRLVSWIKRNQERSSGSSGACGAVVMVMPSTQMLHHSGRQDLVFGIAMHGGVMNVAARLGLAVEYPTQEEGFWNRSENIQNELEQFQTTQPLEARTNMPSSVVLVESGRADLANSIRDHGGWAYFAQRLGTRHDFDRRSQGFWKDERNVYRELVRYMARRYGHWDYPGEALKQCGGTGETPDAAREKEENPVWMRENVHAKQQRNAAKTKRRCLHMDVLLEPPEGLSGDSQQDQAHVHSASTDRPPAQSAFRLRVMPSVDMLKRDGRSDIAFAIQRYHGGVEQFADRHSLCIAADSNQTRPHEELAQWHNFRVAMLEWITVHGCVGVMPTRAELIRTSRNDLRFAMYSHGGYTVVARRLELVRMNGEGWLGQWLGLQAARAGLFAAMNDAKRRTCEFTGEEELPRTLYGDRSAWHRANLHARRQALIQSVLVSEKSDDKLSSNLTAKVQPLRGRILSDAEFEEVRKQYSHLPADDIIVP